MAWDSPIIRISSGKLNTVDDTVIANAGAFGSNTGTRFGGQLGKKVFFDDENIGLMADTSVGDLYTGLYQYVLLDADSATPAVGNIAFWNQQEGISAFEVTMNPDAGLASVLTGSLVAGVFINAITPGRYGYIFVGYGIVDVLYAESITGTAEAGRPVFVSASVPNRADIIDTDPSTTPIFNQYLGVAIETPVAGALRQVDWMSVRSPRM
jgi:hypothetical protein